MIQYLRRSPSTLTASGICIEIVGDRRNVEGVRWMLCGVLANIAWASCATERLFRMPFRVE